MTNYEIGEAVSILKQRVLNVGPMQMTAERHVGLVELIIDCEAILRGFMPKRSREEIEDAIQQELSNDR